MHTVTDIRGWQKPMSRKNGKGLSRGDIVEVEWLDTHSTDRLTHCENEELDEPGPTMA
jgi:hypothetical protein